MNRSTFTGFVVSAVVVTTTSCASLAQSAADIDIVNQTPTSLEVKFTDADGSHVTTTFERPTTNGVWMAASTLLTTGDEQIVFGNNAPKYATSVELRAMNITPAKAIQAFGPSVADAEFDDITIFRLAGGESAVALWQVDVITEIYYVGDFVKEIIATAGPTFCSRSLQICCRRKDIEPPPGSGPLDYPWPNNMACRSVIQNCPAASGDAACDCLWEACNFCFQHPTICSNTPGLQDRSDSACVEGTNQNCDGEDPGPDDPDDPISILIGEIANRLQSLIDVVSQ